MYRSVGRVREKAKCAYDAQWEKEIPKGYEKNYNIRKADYQKEFIPQSA